MPKQNDDFIQQLAEQTGKLPTVVRELAVALGSQLSPSLTAAYIRVTELHNAAKLLKSNADKMDPGPLKRQAENEATLALKHAQGATAATAVATSMDAAGNAMDAAKDKMTQFKDFLIGVAAAATPGQMSLFNKSMDLFAMTLGQKLVPYMIETVAGVMDLVNIFEELDDTSGDGTTAVTLFSTAVQATAEVVDGGVQVLRLLAGTVRLVTGAILEQIGTLLRLVDHLNPLNNGLRELGDVAQRKGKELQGEGANVMKDAMDKMSNLTTREMDRHGQSREKSFREMLFQFGKQMGLSASFSNPADVWKKVQLQGAMSPFEIKQLELLSKSVQLEERLLQVFGEHGLKPPTRG